MAYYKEKVETGNEYVMAVKDFYTYTLNKCMKLPQRWYDTIIKPVIEPVEKARSYTVKANKVYVNVKNQSAEELKKAVEERNKYLVEALREFSAFDVTFEVLVSYIDIGNYERVRMKNQLENIIRNIKNENPELKSIEIKLEHRENELSFVSLGGICNKDIFIREKRKLKHFKGILEEKSIDKYKAGLQYVCVRNSIVHRPNTKMAIERLNNFYSNFCVNCN